MSYQQRWSKGHKWYVSVVYKIIFYCNLQEPNTEMCDLNYSG